MAKEADKKRKLEQDQTEQTATPKRLKQSKGDSAKKSASGSKINGEAAGSASPMVVISRTESRESAKQTPKESKAEKRGSASGKRGDATTTATPSKVKDGQGAQESGNAEASPSSSKKSKKKKRKSAQQGDDALKAEDETVDAKAGADIPAKTVNETPAKTPKKKESQQPAGELVKVGDTPATKKSKAQRKAEREARRNSEQMIDVGLVENEDLTTPNQHGWWLSGPGAGSYLDHDPIFVTDHGKKHLIAATNREIQLLSLDSSLVVRSHVVPEGRSIVCYAPGTSGDDWVDVVYDNGLTAQWNWKTSELAMGTFPAQETTIAMTTARMEDNRSETYYIARSQDTCTIVGERKALYTTQRRLKSIQVLRSGWYIVCVSATALTLGSRKDPSTCEYIWVDIPVEKPIRCADARLVYTGNMKQGSRPELAVAVGDTEGQVHLYSNVSSVFASASQAKLPAPRHLHWHREPVSAVKFSKEGNYLLSGGRETVLVIWQLETGRQQFLPHLTAEIEHIVVSPDGTRYAMKMGDNSIMVLSSSELKPVANFAGLQLPVSNELMEAQGLYVPATTALLHPKDPHQLLLSVPATQPKSAADIAARPFLQAFDVRNTRHISRQALDRNNVTDLARGPEKTAIVPPDVNQLAISADGKWLATVAEWHPPATDLEHVVGKTTGLDAEEVAQLQDQQQLRREIHLRFWHWNEELEMWTLSTRVDSPHARFLDADPGSGAGSVLKLVSDPSSNTFATIGTDSNVKIWKPKLRTKYGLPLKEPDGTDAVDWICKRTIQLPTSTDRADSPMDGIEGEDLPKTVDISEASLVFSQDGSMLACGNASTDENALPLIHFVSPNTGAKITTKTGLVAADQDLLDFGFIDHFFVTLSTGAVRVWNLIDDTHQYTLVLGGEQEDQEEALLAINHADETFAIVSYVPNESNTPLPKVEVYAPKETVCLFARELPTPPVKLLSAGASGSKGYTILFEDGTIRNLSSAAPTTQPPQTLKEAPLAVVEKKDDDVAMSDAIGSAFGLPVSEYAGPVDVVEDDRRVVRPEQLAEIFDTGSSLGLPPVREMFQAVVGLFARKPSVWDVDAMEVDLVDI